MSVLRQWLAEHGLEELHALFAENGVDLPALTILSESDLEELGLSFGMRKRVMAAVRRSAPAADEQRRHLTVLFCDIVGYTALAAEHDPEVLAGIVTAYEDLCAACVSRYEGYLFQRLGDGIVAFFGYPLAHERESERAIRAALDILDGVKSLQHPLDLRIGISTGIVIVAPGGRAAVGDTMNLAARLQSAAEPGTIAVSSMVKKLAGSVFRYGPLGEIELKGVSRSVPAFRVEGLEAVDAFSSAGAGAIGREEELKNLVAIWREVCETGKGRAAGISGEPGIGKSRIAADLCAAIATPENRLIRFQCSPFHIATALHPVIAHLEAVLGFTRALSPEEKLDRIEQLLCGQHGLPPEDVRHVAALLSVPFEHRFGEITLPPRLAKEETLRILLAMVASVASSAPVILLFEDLHWADPTTCEALELLVSKLSSMPVFLVATYRPDFAPPCAGSPDVSLFLLTRLNAEESRALVVRTAGGRPLPPHLEALVIEKTDGVPLFIEELTAALVESGQLAAAGDRYVQAGGNLTITLPETLRDSLTARLDRLVDAKRVAQIGAVIGRSFSRDFLAAVSGIADPELEDALRQLVASGLAYDEERGNGRHYVFKHALVQDAAYDSLLLSQRRGLHHRVARLLTEQEGDLADRQPQIIAHHLSAAGAEDKAVPLWLRAAEIAMKRFAVSEAASHLRKGLSQIPAIQQSGERDVLELRYRAALGPVLVAERGWGHPELSDVMEPAWTLASSLQHRESYLPILNSLWVHYMSTDQLALSQRWAALMLELGEALGEQDLIIVGHRAVSGSAYWQGDFALAHRHGDLLQAMYDPKRHWHVAQLINTDPLTGECVYRAKSLWLQGYPEQALAASQALDVHARQRGHPLDLAFALTLGAQVFDFLNMPEELEWRAEEASALGRRYGVSLFFEMMSEISRGVAWLRAGRYADAAGQIERSAARLASTGHGVWLSYLGALRGEALAHLGATAEATEAIGRSLAHIERGEERCHYPEVLRLAGWVAALRGDAGEAERFYRRSLAAARTYQARSWELRTATSLAALLAETGRAAEGHALLSGIYGWFTEGFATHDLQAANALLPQISSDALDHTPRQKRAGTKSV